MASNMAARKNKNGRRKFFSFSRAVHVYTSTYLFGLLLFFCLSGITLNHRWYGSDATSTLNEIPLNSDLLDRWGLADENSWRPNLNEIGQYFNDAYDFGAAHSIDIDEDYREVVLNFKVPAGFAMAIVSARDKNIILEIERGAVLGVLNDLHKGRHSGSVWFWLIDVSAGLMCIFAITGMIILFQGKKFRMSGSLLAFFGLATPICIYLFFVPKASF